MPNPNIAGVQDDEHLYWLDWLRFGASLLVVGSHARGGIFVEWGRLATESKNIIVALFFALSRVGAESVLMFFVLSGFLVGGKIIERLENGSFNIQTYVIDRFTRIWVPLVPALIWSGMVAYFVNKPIQWFDFFCNLLGLQGTLARSFAENHPLWSLSYEIWFYVLGGCLAVWTTAIDKGKIFISFVLIAGLAVFTKLETVFLFSWVIGASTYWLAKQPKKPKLALFGCLLIIFGYIVTQLRSASTSMDSSLWLAYTPSAEVGTLLFSSGIALLIPFLTKLSPKSGVGQFISTLGNRLAAFSYTLYLTHYPALYLWEYFMPGRHAVIDLKMMIWYFLRVASCVFAAWLFYLAFEKHTPRIRHFISRTWQSYKISSRIVR